MLSQNSQRNTLRIALPSKGELAGPTLAFLASAGLEVYRPNERQYTGQIPSLPQVEVLFQRAPDVFAKVSEGTVDLGITGFDIVSEQSEGNDEVMVLYRDLGYGRCRLVLAVPEAWIDVSSVIDFADLAVHFRAAGRLLKIATKFPNLTRSWLYKKGIVHFRLVSAEGALEAAPSLGYADVIVDITSSGTTLRENRLKEIQGGTLLQSQTCLIGHKKWLVHGQDKLDTVRLFLEMIDAYRQAKSVLSITANIRGESPEAIARLLIKERELAGSRGPTIAKVFPKNITDDDDWYSISLLTDKGRLQEAVDHVRKAGGTDIAVFSPRYIFGEVSESFERIIEQLKRERLIAG